jgi:hypothetical protein
VLTLIAINVFLSVTLPGISLLGHVGGLVAGALATAAMVYAPPARRTEVQVGACVVLALVMIVTIAVQGASMDCAVDGRLFYICAG